MIGQTKGLSYCYYVLESINSEDDDNMRLLRLYRFYGEDTFRTQLIVNNTPLIKSKARQYYQYGGFDDGEVLQDFIQEGNIGLLIAIDRYDAIKSNKAKFSSYAVFWIKKRIFDFIQKNGMTVRYTGKILRAITKYKPLLQEQTNEYGGLQVPIDHIVNEQAAIKRGIIDLHGGNQYVDIDTIDIQEEEIDEEEQTFEQKLAECPLLDDAERKFATAILCSKQKIKLNYKEKQILNAICDKLIAHRVNKS